MTISREKQAVQAKHRREFEMADAKRELSREDFEAWGRAGGKKGGKAKGKKKIRGDSKHYKGLSKQAVQARKIRRVQKDLGLD